MKKLVVVVAMFVFVCGSSFFALAQKPVQDVQPASQVVVVTDTIVKDTATTQPVKQEEEVADSTATDLAK